VVQTNSKQWQHPRAKRTRPSAPLISITMTSHRIATCLGPKPSRKSKHRMVVWKHMVMVLTAGGHQHLAALHLHLTGSRSLVAIVKAPLRLVLTFRNTITKLCSRLPSVPGGSLLRYMCHVYACTHAGVCVCVCVYIYIYIYTYIYIYILAAARII
jgi:hypothetical protein